MVLPPVTMKGISGVDIGLKNSVALRVIVATALLGAGAVIYFENGPRNQVFFLAFILALVYLLSLLYLLLYPIFENHPKSFVALQIAFDIVLSSAVVSVTGGRSSPFIFLYALIIIFADIMLTKIAGYIASTASGTLYISIVLYQFYQELPLSFNRFLSVIWGEKGFTYTFFNLVGFLLIAMLSGYLSERIHVTGKELRESSENLRSLKNLHENIVQSLSSGVITLDLRGKILSINRTALEILGIISNDELVGRDLSFLMPGFGVGELLSKKGKKSYIQCRMGRSLY